MPKVRRDDYGLSLRERRFAHGYAIHLDLEAACHAAGCGPEGRDMLMRPHVMVEIRRLMEQQMELIKLRGVQVMESLLERAFYDPREFVDDKGSPLPINAMGDKAARVSDIELRYSFTRDEYGEKVRDDAQDKITIRAASKDAALDKLLKVLQLIQQTTQVVAVQPVQVIVSPKEAEL